MSRLWVALRKMPGSIVVRAVRFYQAAISPMVGPNCRFQPTCSEYLIQSVTRYGVIIGVARGVWRICRCHPLNRGGYDPP
ncbi:MAG: membrane protein insertion efficiency factor YidD [Pirellulales bacterium]